MLRQPEAQTQPIELCRHCGLGILAAVEAFARDLPSEVLDRLAFLLLPACQRLALQREEVGRLDHHEAVLAPVDLALDLAHLVMRCPAALLGRQDTDVDPPLGRSEKRLCPRRRRVGVAVRKPGDEAIPLLVQVTEVVIRDECGIRYEQCLLALLAADPAFQLLLRR